MQMIHRNKIMEVYHQILTDKSRSSAASFAVQRYFGGTAFAFLALIAYPDQWLALVLPPVLRVLISPASLSLPADRGGQWDWGVGSGHLGTPVLLTASVRRCFGAHKSLCSHTLRRVLGIRTGCSERPSCLNSIGNPPRVLWSLVIYPHGGFTCAQSLFRLPGYPLWLFACPWAWSKDYTARITLLSINSLGNVNLFLARYSRYYSSRDGNTSGPKAAGMVGGEGNLSILAHPSAKLATSSPCQQ